MQLHETPNQRQADPEPPLCPAMRPIDLGEHVEHARQVRRRDADAVVAHRHDRPSVLDGRRQPDAAVRLRVLRRVVQQVRKDLRQPHGVAGNRNERVGNVHRQRLARLLEERTARLDGGPQHGNQIERLLLHVHDAARDARHFQQVVHQPDKMVHLTLHDRARPEASRVGERRQFEQMHARQNGRQRIAQLVAQGRQELVLALIGGTQRFFRANTFFHVAANLVLPAPGAHGGPDRARECGHAHGPLDQRHVAERPHRVLDLRRIGAGPRQHEEREIGPGGLPGEGVGERRAAGQRHSLFGDEDRGGAVLEGREQLFEVRTDQGRNAFGAQQGLRDIRVLPRQDVDQNPAVEIPRHSICHHSVFESMSGLDEPS